jgi:hypothetical protein
MGKPYIVINVYVPNKYHEKRECRRSLLSFSKEYSLDNFIFAGDFNSTIHHGEKGERSSIHDPCREKLEDIISSLDLFDVTPSQGMLP